MPCRVSEPGERTTRRATGLLHHVRSCVSQALADGLPDCRRTAAARVAALAHQRHTGIARPGRRPGEQTELPPGCFRHPGAAPDPALAPLARHVGELSAAVGTCLMQRARTRSGR